MNTEHSFSAIFDNMFIIHQPHMNIHSIHFALFPTFIMAAAATTPHVSGTIPSPSTPPPSSTPPTVKVEKTQVASDSLVLLRVTWNLILELQKNSVGVTDDDNKWINIRRFLEQARRKGLTLGDLMNNKKRFPWFNLHALLSTSQECRDIVLMLLRLLPKEEGAAMDIFQKVLKAFLPNLYGDNLLLFCELVGNGVNNGILNNFSSPSLHTFLGDLPIRARIQQLFDKDGLRTLMRMTRVSCESDTSLSLQESLCNNADICIRELVQDVATLRRYNFKFPPETLKILGEQFIPFGNMFHLHFITLLRDLNVPSMDAESNHLTLGGFSPLAVPFTQRTVCQPNKSKLAADNVEKPMFKVPDARNALMEVVKIGEAATASKVVWTKETGRPLIAACLNFGRLVTSCARQPAALELLQQVIKPWWKRFTKMLVMIPPTYMPFMLSCIVQGQESHWKVLELDKLLEHDAIIRMVKTEKGVLQFIVLLAFKFNASSMTREEVLDYLRTIQRDVNPIQHVLQRTFALHHFRRALKKKEEGGGPRLERAIIKVAAVQIQSALNCVFNLQNAGFVFGHDMFATLQRCIKTWVGSIPSLCVPSIALLHELGRHGLPMTREEAEKVHHDFMEAAAAGQQQQRLDKKNKTVFAWLEDLKVGGMKVAKPKIHLQPLSADYVRTIVHVLTNIAFQEHKQTAADVQTTATTEHLDNSDTDIVMM